MTTPRPRVPIWALFLMPLSIILAAWGPISTGPERRAAPGHYPAPPGSTLGHEAMYAAPLTPATVTAPIPASVTRIVLGPRVSDVSLLPPTPAPSGMARTHPAARPSVLPPLKLDLAWSVAEGPGSVRLPIALAVDRQQRLYVADAGDHRLHTFGPAGDILTTWGGEGDDSGQFRFRQPAHCEDVVLGRCAPALGGGVAVDGHGRVYVADYGNHRVQQFDSTGRFLRTWGHEGNGPGEFRLPSGIAVDGQGHVYVLDSGNHRIQRFDHTGVSLGGWGDKGLGLGHFRYPRALAVDERGQVYVADPANALVQTFDQTGRFLGQWPWETDTSSGHQQPMVGIAVDRQGQVLVTDPTAGIVQLDQGGQVLAIWGSDWRGEGHLRGPVGIAVAAGDIYVADQGTRRVLRFRPLLPETS